MTSESYIGEHKVLQAIYKGICIDNNVDGFFFEKRGQVRVDQGLSTQSRRTEGEDGHCADISFSGLVEIISHTCGCLVHRTWCSTSLAGGG